MQRQRRLSALEQRFVQEFIIDDDGKAAAMRCGIAPDQAADRAWKLLQKEDVQAAISERKKLIARKVDVRVERLIAEAARLAFADMGDFVELRQHMTMTGMDSNDDPIFHTTTTAVLKPWDGTVDTAAIQELSVNKDGTIKIKLYNKRDAIETLGRMIGAFKDGGTGGDSREIVVRFADPNEGYA